MGKPTKKQNSSERAYLKNLSLLAFADPETVNEMEREYSMEDLDRCDIQIRECQAMLEHFIETENEEEILCWKRYLQQAKTEKRMIRNMIKTNLTERNLITA